jgi:hypothetical protein
MTKERKRTRSEKGEKGTRELTFDPFKQKIKK